MGIDHNDSFAETVLYGMVSGVISVVSGHPLDTIKVRFQTGQTKNVFRSLYSGVAPALMSTPINWLTCVTAYGAILRRLGGKDTPQEHAVAGALTGASLGVVMSPLQLLKCNAQVDKHSSWQVCKRIANEHGWQILRRGMALTVAVDVIGLGMYFGSNQYFVQNLHKFNIPEAAIPGLAGGLAGCACWGSVFPIDTMKSRWQTNLRLRTLRQTWSGTQRSLWRGFWFSQMRAFFVNGFVWLSVDQVKTMVRSYKTRERISFGPAYLDFFDFDFFQLQTD